MLVTSQCLHHSREELQEQEEGRCPSVVTVVYPHLVPVLHHSIPHRWCLSFLQVSCLTLLYRSYSTHLFIHMPTKSYHSLMTSKFQAHPLLTYLLLVRALSAPKISYTYTNLSRLFIFCQKCDNIAGFMKGKWKEIALWYTGLEIMFKIWVSIRKTCLRIWIPWQFLGLLSESLRFSIYLVGFLSEPCSKIWFPLPFWGVSEIWKSINLNPDYTAPRIILAF